MPGILALILSWRKPSFTHTTLLISSSSGAKLASFEESRRPGLGGKNVWWLLLWVKVSLVAQAGRVRLQCWRPKFDGFGRSPGEGKSYPVQYSGLENSKDCIVLGVAKSGTWLCDFHFHFYEWGASLVAHEVPSGRKSKNAWCLCLSVCSQYINHTWQRELVWRE